MALEDTPRLGCGRSIDRIWATIDQLPSVHEQHCDQCQTARARLQRLREATRSLRDNDEHDPTLRPRPGVRNAIMDVARAEIRRSKRIPLTNTDAGTIEISAQALSSLIRYAAVTVPGVHARRCRINIRTNTTELTDAAPPLETAAGGLPGPGLVIDLRVAVAPGIEIPPTTEALRREIVAAFPAGVGIDAGTINITVEDLYNV